MRLSGASDSGSRSANHRQKASVLIAAATQNGGARRELAEHTPQQGAGDETSAEGGADQPVAASAIFQAP